MRSEHNDLCATTPICRSHNMLCDACFFSYPYHKFGPLLLVAAFQKKQASHKPTHSTSETDLKTSFPAEASVGQPGTRTYKTITSSTLVMDMLMCIYINVSTCIHTYIHTYVHTDIRTYVRTYVYCMGASYSIGSVFFRGR